MKKIYKRGARKEYQIIKDLKDEGWPITQRTAGSHSPVDIIAINPELKTIKFIQSKRTLNKNMAFIDPKLKKRIEYANKQLNGLFLVVFEVL